MLKSPGFQQFMEVQPRSSGVFCSMRKHPAVTRSRAVAEAIVLSGGRGERHRYHGLHGAVIDYSRGRHEARRVRVFRTRGDRRAYYRWNRGHRSLRPGSVHAGAGTQREYDQCGEDKKGRYCSPVHRHHPDMAEHKDMVADYPVDGEFNKLPAW